MPNKSDGQLQDDVVAELEWDPSVDHADIGVSVNDGVVTLAGYVKSFPQKVAARRGRARACRGTEGALRVRSQDRRS
jgi:osmotically-inducible protein OsmY